MSALRLKSRLLIGVADVNTTDWLQSKLAVLAVSSVLDGLGKKKSFSFYLLKNFFQEIEKEPRIGPS